MHQGNWTCSGCGGAITELPFEPRSTTGLMCRACHAKGRSTQSGEGSSEQSSAPAKTRIEGNWSCSGCGNPITSLPFTPRDTSNLLCIDCYKKSKA